MLISRPKAKQTTAETGTTARDTLGEQLSMRGHAIALQALSSDGCAYGCGRCDLLNGCDIGRTKIGLV